MIKHLFLFLLLALASLGAKSQTDDPSYDNTWQVAISFHLPALKPQALQYTYVDFDPTGAFMQSFDKNLLENALKGVKEEKNRIATINAFIEIGWDMMFNKVKGGDVWLLTSKGSWTMADVSPVTKKWLISKVFYLHGKPYCFMFPIDAGAGDKQKVVLNKHTMISLADVYSTQVNPKK
jgi:hypothetical protein